MVPLVEARRDGRLDDREAASIERHLAVCADCRALDRDLARIKELAGGEPRPVTSLEHRRGRMRLLQAAATLDAPGDRSTLSGVSAGSRERRSTWKVPAVAALAASLLMGVGSWHGRLAEGSAAAASEPPAATIARQIEVERRAAPAIARSIAPEPRRTIAAVEAPVARPVPHAAPAAAATTDATSFADGVGSLARGNFGEAVERLGEFRRKNPHDARAEDAAFLVVMALERAGKHEAAAQAAREYLQSYPEGYRRGEAAAIASRRD
jgi:TolA-binding protein